MPQQAVFFTLFNFFLQLLSPYNRVFIRYRVERVCLLQVICPAHSLLWSIQKSFHDILGQMSQNNIRIHTVNEKWSASVRHICNTYWILAKWWEIKSDRFKHTVLLWLQNFCFGNELILRSIAYNKRTWQCMLC